MKAEKIPHMIIYCSTADLFKNYYTYRKTLKDYISGAQHLSEKVQVNLTFLNWYVTEKTLKQLVVYPFHLLFLALLKEEVWVRAQANSSTFFVVAAVQLTNELHCL